MSFIVACVLQWSHVRLNVETVTRGHFGLYLYFRASMEPRSSERGNLNTIKEILSREPASMEPRSSERGNGPFGGTTKSEVSPALCERYLLYKRLK